MAIACIAVISKVACPPVSAPERTSCFGDCDSGDVVWVPLGGKILSPLDKDREPAAVLTSLKRPAVVLRRTTRLCC